jgi:hypothetical protein
VIDSCVDEGSGKRILTLDLGAVAHDDCRPHMNYHLTSGRLIKEWIPDV